MALSAKSSKIGRRTHKIIFMGDSGVGKTSIIQRYSQQKFDQFYNPTIGIDFVGKVVNYKGAQCKVQLWDTAGQQKFKSLIPSYQKDAACSVFIFDVTKKESLNNLESWINIFKLNKGDKSFGVICGNKSDLEKNFSKETLEALIQKYKMPYYAISAKSGQGIEQVFFKILEMIETAELKIIGEIMEKHKKMKQIEYEEALPTKQPLTRHQTESEISNTNPNIKLNSDKENENGKGQKRFCCF